MANITSLEEGMSYASYLTSKSHQEVAREIAGWEDLEKSRRTTEVETG